MTAAERKRLSRPFDAKILKQAEEIARSYRIIIESDEDVGFFGSLAEMPLVMGDGKTVAKCVDSVIEAAIVAVATMLESGDKPPAPAREGKRDQQVNIRLTAEEKLRLEEAARREGFRSLSDFLRASGLNRAG